MHDVLPEQAHHADRTGTGQASHRDAVHGDARGERRLDLAEFLLEDLGDLPDRTFVH